MFSLLGGSRHSSPNNLLRLLVSLVPSDLEVCHFLPIYYLFHHTTFPTGAFGQNQQQQPAANPMFGNLGTPSTTAGTSGGFGAYLGLLSSICLDLTICSQALLPTQTLTLPVLRVHCLGVRNHRRVSVHLEEVVPLRRLAAEARLDPPPIMQLHPQHLPQGCSVSPTRRPTQEVLSVAEVCSEASPLPQVLDQHQVSRLLTRLFVTPPLFSPIYFIISKSYWNL
jgi:hypothetical protein